MHPLALAVLLPLLAVEPTRSAPPPLPTPQATDERLEHALALLARLNETVVLGELDVLTVGNVPTWLRLKGFPVQVDTVRLVPRADMSAFEERVPAGETTYGALLGSFARATGSEFDPWSVDSDGFTLLLLPESGRDRLALTAMYDVSALALHRASQQVPQGDTTEGVQKELGTIVELLHEHVVPDGWTEMGGKLVSLREDKFNLIITGAPAVHQSIREFLRQLEIAAGIEQILVSAQVFEFPSSALGNAAFSSDRLDACVAEGTAKLISDPRVICAPTGDATLSVTSRNGKLEFVIHADRSKGATTWACEATIEQANCTQQFQIPFQVGAQPSCAMTMTTDSQHCIAIRVRAWAVSADPAPIAPAGTPAVR